MQCTFIEHNVTTNNEFLNSCIKQTIVFKIKTIAYKNAFVTFQFQLAICLIKFVSIGYATKCFQVLDFKSPLTLLFFRCHSIYCSVGTSHFQVYNYVNDLHPKYWLQALLMQHALSSLHDGTIEPFYQTIMLWCIRCRGLVVDSMFFKELLKFF